MSSQAARSHMSIGEVLALLQGEFPDVTVSKIRFLEGEGLIEPERSPSGFRRFTHADVDRLRYILTAQRDQYLPLRVIKDHLEALGADGRTRPHGLREAGASGVARPEPERRLSREEFLAAADLPEEMLDELEEYGLLQAVARRYDEEALAVARSVGALARFGFHPRHLRAVRAAAEREAGLVEQAVAPLLRRRGPGAKGEAEESAREIAGLLLDLHGALVRAGVRSVLGQ
ncbi:transcriptional regulator FtsR [Sinosporangium siamense]|uniref:MerR family transcriptional regulator n=1 Tax=Sinosporangium siamense TaxID=1367973 RepID=A0A919RRI1_9ACTN|nr:MerR family transcriptional regulator [Sinosporangium siamense]GII97409.1 MerR family transcriptional regulator [Sinosporangium siamense]